MVAVKNANENETNEQNNSQNDTDEDREEIVIEQRTQPRSFKQAEIMTAILEHGRITDDGSLDVSDALEYVSTQRGYAEETFGKYGRVARYTTEVDEPEVEVVREPSGRGGETQAEVLSLIDQYATVRPDGTVSANDVANIDRDDGSRFDSKVIMRNIGRATRVNVPWDARPVEEQSVEHGGEQESSMTDTYSEATGVGGTFDDPVLNQLFSKDDVPSDPVAAFKRGWDLRDALIQEDS